MNVAHLHMVVNHIPIMGTIFGLGILITALVKNNTTATNIAYVLFITATIFAAISSSTGEVAEDLVKDIPSVEKKIIDQHAHFAALLTFTLYVLGVISAVGIFFNFRKKSRTKTIAFLAILLGIMGVFFIFQAGKSGGDIRHTEFRTERQSTFFIY
jgi:uncharacterized membrane protein